MKKWGKFILLSFISGLGIFFLLIYISENFSHLLPQRDTRVGLVGAYEMDNLPSMIVSDLSRGLTKVTPTGEIEPDIASSWEIKNNGKTYVFKLKEGLTFVDGDEVTSESITYEFADVQAERPDKKTIVYHLKDAYAPFLVTTSRPIFKEGYKGISDYKISDLELNAGAVSSLTLTSIANKSKSKTYIFYPNQEAVKTAFLLGETTDIAGINDLNYTKGSLTDMTNIDITKSTNYQQLVTIFYNTKDPVISDNKLRKALTYALPNTFEEGERTYVPYSPHSIFYNESAASKSQDIPHAKLLVDASLNAASQSAAPELTLKTLTKYRSVADRVVNEWKKLGMTVTIEEVNSVPDTFQMYLGDFSVPRDPDQYTLWHSDQRYNITQYRNLRVDKLLEDGRKTISIHERIRIYNDFQKYLLEDAVSDTPASFLYFPYTYSLSRR